MQMVLLMKKYKRISQEGLKAIACFSMLVEHAKFLFPQFSIATTHGQVMLPIYTIIGRIAYPIFAFLLVEGFHHTKDKKIYLFRLFVLAVVSELPFDLFSTFRWYWGSNNVVFTLILGLVALQIMCCQCQDKNVAKLIGLSLIVTTAELVHSDYGAGGVLLIILFEATYNVPSKRLLQFLGMMLVFSIMQSPCTVLVGKHLIGIQYFGVLSLIPISLYNGRKYSSSKTVQRIFYVFYPVHLISLYIILLYVTSV